MKASRSPFAWAAVAALLVTLSGCGSSTRPVSPTLALDTTPLSIPDGVASVFDPYVSTMTLHWNPSPSPDVAHYQVYVYSPDPSRESSFVLLGVTDTAHPSYPLPNASTEKTYTLRVRAVDGAGNFSAFSTTLTVTVPAFVLPGDGGGVSPDDHRFRTDS